MNKEEATKAYEEGRQAFLNLVNQVVRDLDGVSIIQASAIAGLSVVPFPANSYQLYQLYQGKSNRDVALWRLVSEVNCCPVAGHGRIGPGLVAVPEQHPGEPPARSER